MNDKHVPDHSRRMSMTPTTQEGRDTPPALAAFLRDHFAPVAKPPAIVYPTAWKPIKGDMEPPF